MENEKSILVVGCWHLGSVYACCMARNSSNRVQLWDQREKVRTAWTAGHAPIFEAGLDNIIAGHFQKNLNFSSDLTSAVTWANWIFFAYDTEINESDEVQMGIIEEGLVKVLAEPLNAGTKIVFTSQLPVKTSRRFLAQIRKRHPEWRGSLFYFPENLRLGNAIESFDRQDRVVLGVEHFLSSQDQESLISEFRQVTGLMNNPVELMSLESAEMVKHALNAFIGTCIVFANEISDLCEKTGANAWDVLASLKKDSRVGPRAFLNPGLGFAGGTIGRDVRTLSKQPSDFFNDLYNYNDARNKWVVNTLKQELGALDGKEILLLGVTYKSGTSTVRRSPALAIGELLRKKGVNCRAIDPMADFTELSEREVAAIPFKTMTDPKAAFAGADAAVLITDWPQFKELNWKDLTAQMKMPLLLDTKKFLSSEIKDTKVKWIVPGLPREGANYE